MCGLAALPFSKAASGSHLEKLLTLALRGGAPSLSHRAPVPRLLAFQIEGYSSLHAVDPTCFPTYDFGLVCVTRDYCQGWLLEAG